MEQQSITIGEITYTLQRVFQGDRSLPHLLADRIAQNYPSAQRIDGGREREV